MYKLGDLGAGKEGRPMEAEPKGGGEHKYERGNGTRASTRMIP